MEVHRIGIINIWNICPLRVLVVLLESTAVDRLGKISDADMCLYNDTHEKNLKKLIKFLKSKNDIKYEFRFRILKKRF